MLVLVVCGGETLFAMVMEIKTYSASNVRAWYTGKGKGFGGGGGGGAACVIVEHLTLADHRGEPSGSGPSLCSHSRQPWLGTPIVSTILLVTLSISAVDQDWPTLCPDCLPLPLLQTWLFLVADSTCPKLALELSH